MTHDNYPGLSEENEPTELEKLHEDVKDLLIKYRLLERRWMRSDREKIEKALVALSEGLTAIESHNLHEDLDPLDLMYLAYIKQGLINSQTRLGMV